jgi:phosphatidylglycerophosphate synthase
VIGAIADALDGTLARHLGAETELGAFLDATGDRVASVALLVAFALGVGTASAYQASLALVAASLLLALTRAKAESVGARGQIRTLHRSGRSIWLSGALMVGPSLAAALGRSPSEALLIAFWALTAVTGAALAVVVARTVRALS